MENDYEGLISSFISDKVGISEHFLSDELANHLKANLLALHKKKLLVTAGTGNAEKFSQDNAVRSDSIYWLDREHNNTYENEFLDQVDDFIKYLNRSCFAGITGYEFHYTLYEKGSFYKKHLDQFRNNKSRAYSMIMYLNTNWQQGDGGELCIHHQHHLQNISPDEGKSVFFKSDELEHEVLLTHKPRMSITGWLRVD